MITVKYRAIDGYTLTRRYKTIEGARAFAQKWVGVHPDLGTCVAVSSDGIGTVYVTGAKLSELFPTETAVPITHGDWDDDFNYVGSRHHY